MAKLRTFELHFVSLFYTSVVQKVNIIQNFCIEKTFIFKRSTFFQHGVNSFKQDVRTVIAIWKFTGVAVIPWMTKLICLRMSNMYLQSPIVFMVAHYAAIQ